MAGAQRDTMQSNYSEVGQKSNRLMSVWATIVKLIRNLAKSLQFFVIGAFTPILAVAMSTVVLLRQPDVGLIGMLNYIFATIISLGCTTPGFSQALVLSGSQGICGIDAPFSAVLSFASSKFQSTSETASDLLSVLLDDPTGANQLATWPDFSQNVGLARDAGRSVEDRTMRVQADLKWLGIQQRVSQRFYSGTVSDEVQSSEDELAFEYKRLHYASRDVFDELFREHLKFRGHIASEVRMLETQARRDREELARISPLWESVYSGVPFLFKFTSWSKILLDMETFFKGQQRALRTLLERSNALQTALEDESNALIVMLHIVEEELKDSLQTSSDLWLERSSEIISAAATAYMRLQEHYQRTQKKLAGRHIEFHQAVELLTAVENRLEGATRQLKAALRRDELLGIDPPKKRGGIC